MRIKPLPSALYLRLRLEYDPITGIVTWKPMANPKPSNWNIRFAEKIVGNFDNGYYRVNIDNDKHLLHRVIWKLVTGNDPLYEIDHCDGDTKNNSWNNLREANHNEQCYNRGLRSDNTSGIKGVHKQGNKWKATITVDGKQKYLGMFNTKQQAKQVVEQQRSLDHGIFARYQ